MGFIMDGGNRAMTTTRYHVLCHIERVRNHVALEVDAAHMDACAAWAHAANAILFLTDGSVRTPNGLVLVAPDTGDADPDAEVPYPEDAEQRKAATDRQLAAQGVRVAKSLPPVVAEVEVELRAPADVAHRCYALFACALRAESLASNRVIPAAELRARLPAAFAALSPREAAFLAEESPAKQDIVNHVWRYEALAVLAWAVGARRELPPATRVCDVPALAKTMLDADAEAFVRDARLRPTSELLDALDLAYRLHWATTDARVHDREPPGGLDPGVVAERHYALNWLTRFQDADWDDVDTPT
jgi:hypothetical protein